MSSMRPTVPSPRGVLAAVAIADSEPLAPFVVSRLLFVAATVAVAAVLHTSAVLHLWDRWDSVWYLLVAARGYFWIPGATRSDVAFYPLLPILIDVVHGVTGAGRLLAGLVVSNAAFALALVYLSRLARLEGASRRVLWLVALFPTAFFFAAAYSESLFLLAAVAAFYYARGGRFSRAAAAAALGTLSRPTGFILALPVAYAAWREQGLLAACRALVPPLLVQVGIWLYLALIGGPGALFSVERGWHRELTWPWVGFIVSVQRMLDQRPLWVTEDAGLLLTTVSFLILTVIAARHLDATYRVYLAAFWLIVLSAPAVLNQFYAPFLSMDRFVLGLFPVAIWAARALTPRWYTVWVGTSVLGLVAITVTFLLGQWVG